MAHDVTGQGAAARSDAASQRPRHPPVGKRRVLLVSQYDIYPHTVGGLPIRSAEFARLLTPALDVRILTMTGIRGADGDLRPPSLRPAALDRFTRTRSWRLGRLASAAWDATVPGPRTARLLREIRPDYLFFSHFDGLPRQVLRALLGIPAPVVTYFGNSLGDNTADALTLDRLAALHTGPPRPVTFVFNCDYLRRYYGGQVSDHFGRRRQHGYPDHFHSVVIYDGVDTDRFQPAPLLPAPPVFAFLGRPVHPGKGFLDFCRTMTLLPERAIGGIDIIGTGNQLEEGLSLIKGAGRGHLVRHTGLTFQPDVPERLRGASVLVLPTRDDSIPIAVTEAMATGLAVVTSRLAGIPELVRDGETGLLVQPDNIQQLVAACTRLAEDGLLRARLGAAARALTVTHFQRRVSLERMATVLTQGFSLEGSLDAMRAMDI